MEKNKNKSLLILVIILSLLVVGLSSYLIYDKMIAKDDNEVVDNNYKDNDKLYSEYLLNLKNNLEKNYTERDSETKINSNFVNGDAYTVTINKNGVLSLSTRKDDYEISNNVLEMFLVDVGNSGDKTLYFIKDDGTLNSFCVDCVLNEGVKVIQSEYKNIVNVVNSAFGITYSGAYGPIFIDIEGNVFTELK